MLNKMLLGKEISQKRYAFDKRVSPEKSYPVAVSTDPKGKTPLIMTMLAYRLTLTPRYY